MSLYQGCQAADWPLSGNEAAAASRSESRKLLILSPHPPTHLAPPMPIILPRSSSAGRPRAPQSGLPIGAANQGGGLGLFGLFGWIGLRFGDTGLLTRAANYGGPGR